MVKGISRQIILLDSPDQKIFEQVIFILKDGQREVSDTDLLKEAKCLIPGAIRKRKGRKYFRDLLWATGGGMVIGCIWFLTAVL